MKLRCLAIIMVLLACSAFCFADSMDNFSFTSTSGYSYSFQLPASSDFTGYSNQPPGVFGFGGVQILVNGPQSYDGYDNDSFDVYFESDSYPQITCNEGPLDCFLIRGAVFTSPLYSGTFVNPAFILGNYTSPDGNTTLSITRVPDVSTLPALIISALGICFAMKKNYFRRMMVSKAPTNIVG